MSTLVVFVDGRVGIGKSTFIDMLEFSLRKCVDSVHVIREPLDRDIVGGMVEDVGYHCILDFIMSRKDRMLVDLIERHEHDDSKRNIILVERSFLGDLAVRGMVFRMYDIKNRFSYKYRDMFTSLLIREGAGETSKLLTVDGAVDGAGDIDGEQSALIHLYDTANVPYVDNLLNPTKTQVVRVEYIVPMLSNVVKIVKELLYRLDVTNCDVTNFRTDDTPSEGDGDL